MTEEEIIQYALKLLYAGEHESLNEYYKKIKFDDLKDPTIILRYIDFLSWGNHDENYINRFLKEIEEKSSNSRLLRRAYEYYLKNENYEKAYEFLMKLIDLEPENFGLYIDIIELCRNKMFDINLAFSWYKKMNQNCSEPVAVSKVEEENWKSIALFFKKRFPDYSPQIFSDLLSEKYFFNKREIKVDQSNIYFILVDGSNLAYYYEKNSKKSAKATNLYYLVEFFEQMREEYSNVDYTILVDASLVHIIDKRSELNKLIDKGFITQIPAGTSADDFMIEYFKLHPENTFLVSNDQFKDLLEKESKPTRNLILSHKYPLMIIFKEVIIPNFPFPLKSRMHPLFKNDAKSTVKSLEQSKPSSPSDAKENEDKTAVSKEIAGNFIEKSLKEHEREDKKEEDKQHEMSEPKILSKIEEKRDELWLKRIASVYKEIQMHNQQANFGNLCQRIKEEFGRWTTEFPELIKFADFMNYFAEKYQLGIIEKPKNNFILSIPNELLKCLIDSNDPKLKKYYYSLLADYVSNKGDKILKDDFSNAEKAQFNYFLTVAQIIHQNKKSVCFNTVLEVINRYPSEELRKLKYESILEVVANPKFKGILQRQSLNGDTYLTVHVFDYDFFTEYLPKEIIKKPCEFEIVNSEKDNTNQEDYEKIEEYNSSGKINEYFEETETYIEEENTDPKDYQFLKKDAQDSSSETMTTNLEQSVLADSFSEENHDRVSQDVFVETQEIEIQAIENILEEKNKDNDQDKQIETIASKASQPIQPKIETTANRNPNIKEIDNSTIIEGSKVQSELDNKEIKEKDTKIQISPKGNTKHLTQTIKKPDLLEDFDDTELLWLCRILNASQLVKRGGKEIGLTELASALLKMYGINSWIKDLPQYTELVVMMQDFSKKFDFIMKITPQQDYILYFSAQVFEIGRNAINYLLNKNKKIIEWKQSLLDFEFSIDEIVAINRLAEIMDKMISESKLPIWRELRERIQEAISNTKPQINISKGIEDFIEKLNMKGIIGFAKINGEITIQLRKRMTEVGIFDEN